jgi:site-specific recombinase XerD/ribosomal protein L40E
MDLYKYHEKHGSEASIRRNLLSGTITQGDVDLFHEYLQMKVARDGICVVRVTKIASALCNFRRFMPVEYSSASTRDVYMAVTAINQSELKQNTRSSYIRIFKTFYNWLIDEGYSTLGISGDRSDDKARRKIKEIKAPGIDSNTTSPDEILTPDEILRLIKAGNSSRDRAFISVLYEGGLRISDLSNLKWKDLVPDEYGYKCRVDDEEEKNGKQRFCRLVMSTQYIAQWYNDTPRRAPTDSVFINTRHPDAGWSYAGVNQLLHGLATKAGITRRIHLHLFRKSRITHMINQGFQESKIKESMWGNVNTQMFKTYVCLSEEDLDNEFLKQAGMAKSKTSPTARLDAQVCGRCNTINPPGIDWCVKCGKPVSTKAIQDEENTEKELQRNVEYMVAHHMDKIMAAYKQNVGL